MQDVISREIIVKANKEKVYGAITDPAKVVAWFPDAIENGTLEEGQNPLFIFNGGKNKAQVHIEKATPFDYFSFRWIPGGNDKGGEDVMSLPHTLVEFLIEEQSEGTKVTVKESGFAALPVEMAEKSFKDNSGGWDYMMNRLEKVFSQQQ